MPAHIVPAIRVRSARITHVGTSGLRRKNVYALAVLTAIVVALRWRNKLPGHPRVADCRNCPGVAVVTSFIANFPGFDGAIAAISECTTPATSRATDIGGVIGAKQIWNGVGASRSRNANMSLRTRT